MKVVPQCAYDLWDRVSSVTSTKWAVATTAAASSATTLFFSNISWLTPLCSNSLNKGIAEKAATIVMSSISEEDPLNPCTISKQAYQIAIGLFALTCITGVAWCLKSRREDQANREAIVNDPHND